MARWRKMQSQTSSPPRTSPEDIDIEEIVSHTPEIIATELEKQLQVSIEEIILEIIKFLKNL